MFFYKMVLASAPFNEVMTTSPSAASRPDSSMRDTDRIALYRFFGPRFWPLWLGLGLVRMLNALPLRAQLAVGRALGRLAHRFARRDGVTPSTYRRAADRAPSVLDEHGIMRSAHAVWE